MTSRTRPPILEYAFAAAATAAALWLRWLFHPWLGPDLPFATLFGAVAVAVWYGGYAPGLLATALGYLGATQLFLEPRGLAALARTDHALGLAAYLFSCLVIVALGEGLRRARRRAERAAAEREAAQRTIAETHDRTREVRERFQAFMDNTPALVFIKDEEGRYEFVNRAIVEGFGWTEADWLGRTDFHVFPDEIARQLRENDRLVRESGSTLQFRERIQRPQGPGYALSMKFPIRDAQGRSLVGGVAVDVTDQVRVEEALQESEAKFRRIVETAHEGIWLLDEEARVTFVNQRMANLLGYEPEQMLGRAKWEFLLGGDRERVRELFARRRAGISEVLDVCFEHRQGRPVWMLMAARPVMDERGVFRGTLDMFTDVTERKHLEGELQRRVEQLAEADRRKDEFLATLAHELRNPLAPILNAVELMRVQGSGNPELESLRALAERQVRQMSRLIDDLLDVSRITRNKLSLRRERIELGAVLRSAVETSRPGIDAARHELAVTLPDEPLHLHADLTRLAQVFVNLLNNAAKYTPPGGRIWLGARREGDDVVVSVRDTGIGIGPEQMPYLFEMFSQATPALERAQGGLGIGLSLARGLVELHGGSIDARSEGLGKGSEFHVRLPVLASAEEEGGDPERTRRDRPPSRRILVVDDNRDAADSLGALLRLRRHDVRIARDGREALRAAEELQPEVVLLDIGLPEMNGYEVAQRLRREPWGRRMLLVAVTGWGQEEDKRRAGEAGFDHHLTKPVTLDALEALLAGAEPAGPGRAA